MATSGELLALTSAVVQPLCTAGHKDKYKDIRKDAGVNQMVSCTTCGIFSPLPSGADGSLCAHHASSPQHSVEGGKCPFPGIDSANSLSSLNRPSDKNPKVFTGTVATASPSKTPSPMTISAQDIEAGSMDFTELVTGMNVSSSSQSHTQQDWGTEFQWEGKENLATPRGTSSPAVPIKVRVSAKKLREIRSPLLSRDSEDGSNASKGLNTQRALTPSDISIGPQRAAKRQTGGPQEYPLKTSQKSLKQGTLQKVHEDTPSLLDTLADNSLIITTAGLEDGKSTARRLLEQQKKKENPNTAPKIRVIPVTTYSQKKVATADKDNTANVHSTQSLRSPGMTQLPVDNAVKLYPIPPGGTMSVEPISSVPPQIQKQKLHSSTDKKKDQVDQVQFPVQPANTTGHAEAVSPSIDVVTTAKLVATCTAAATAAVLASSDKPRHINEDTYSPVLSVKNHHKPPAALNINTYPHTQAEDMPHSKYGINDDVQGKKPLAQVDENNAHVVHKRAHVQKTHSSSTTNKTELDACSRGSIVGPTHALQDVAQTDGNTNEKHGVVERQVAKVVTRTSKITPRNQPLSRRETLDGSPGRSGNHVYTTDILKRLQRLEELQHVNIMDTVEKRREAMDSTSARISTSPRLLSSQSFKVLTPAAAHSRLAGNKRLADQCLHTEEGTEVTGQEQNITHGPKKHLRATRNFHRNPGSAEELKYVAARKPVSEFPVSKSMSANAEEAVVDDETGVISRVEKVLSDVRSARDQLEMQCALLEAESQQVDLQQLAHSLSTRSGDISSPLCELKVTEFISSLQQKWQQKEKEMKEKDEGAEEGRFEEREHLKAPSRVERSVVARDRGKPLRGKSAGMHKFTPNQETNKAISLKRRVSGNRDMGRKQSTKEPRPQCIRSEEARRLDSPGNCRTCTDGKSGSQQQQGSIHPRHPPQSNCQRTLDQPPISSQPSFDLPAARPLSTLPGVLTQPLGGVGAYHHTVYPMPANYYHPSPTPTMAFGPYPLSVAIPLGAPCNTLPSSQHVSRPSEDLLREGRATSTGTKLEVVDACLQTSTDHELHSHHPHCPVHLVTESLPGVHIEGEQQLSEPPSQTLDDPVGPQQWLASEETSSLHVHTYAAVEDTSVDTVQSEAGEGAMVVSIQGHCHPPPSPPHPHSSVPPHPTPGRIGEGGAGGDGWEGETISAEELDEKLREQMKSKALEWVQQELLVRVLAQVDYPRDPPLTHPADESSNSCSTCSPPPDPHDMALAPLLGQPGLQLFVDTGVPVDGELVEQLVREAIQEQIGGLVRELQGGEKMVEWGESGEGRSSELPADDDLSYTPPESGATSNTSTAPLLSTPQPTPPPSPTHTPRAKGSITVAVEEVPTPTATPTSTPPPSVEAESFGSKLLEDVSTPQPTEDDTDVSMATDTCLHVPSHGIASMESADDTPHQGVPTPTATPPSQPISPGSPPQSTERAQPVVTPAIHTKEPSLSESCSSSSSSSHPQKHTLTPTPSTTTTDKEISMGEYVLNRPPLLLANSSLSEGEVPLSPGDVRWYTVYSTKLAGRDGPHGGQRKTRSGNSTVQAFVDLKSSPDPSTTSDTSELSDSLKSETKQELSRGEIKRPQKHSAIDPFEKFLSKLNSSTPEDSSNLTAPNTLSELEDNTLSEMPSIDKDDLSHGEVFRPVATPLVKGQQRRQPKAIAPKFHVGQQGHCSPGEVQRHPKPSGQDSTVTLSLSKGEVPLRIRTRTGRRSKSVRVRELNSAVVRLVSSPGEIRMPSETRNGIDVINISRNSSKLFSSRSDKTASPTHTKTVNEEHNIRLPEANSAKVKIHESEPTPAVSLPSQVIQVQPDLQIQVTEAAETANGHSKNKLQTSSNQDSSPDIPFSLNNDSRFSIPGFTNPVHSPPLLVPSRPPITVTIPTGTPDEHSRSHSAGKSDSYTSDFEFSSISVPGFD